MDFAQAKKIFAGYLKQYDTKNDKIRLKIVHTYGVVDAARLIAEGLASPERTLLWPCTSRFSTTSAASNS